MPTFLSTALVLLLGVSAMASGAPVTFDFKTPEGVALRAGVTYVADFDRHRIEMFDGEGRHLGGWGSPGSGPGEFNGPGGITVGDDGFVYVADFFNHRIQVFSAAGEFVREWGRLGSAPGRLHNPIAVAVDAGGTVWVSDLGNHRVQGFDDTGRLIAAWGSKGRGDGELLDPWGIAVAMNGDLIVADHGNDRVQRFTPQGEFVARMDAGHDGEGALRGPMAVAVTADGSLIVSDLDPRRLQRYAANGTWTGRYETPAHGGLRYGLALDGDALIATDEGRRRVDRIALAIEDVKPVSSGLSFAMTRTWPNPAHEATTMRFTIPSHGWLHVAVYSVEGRRVRALGPTECAPGERSLVWDGRTDRGDPTAAGLYFLRARFEHDRSTRTVQGKIVRLP